MDSQEPNPEASSLAERFTLDEIVRGLATDLSDLRAGKISISKAMASAALAKQIFNGVRLAINVQRMIEDAAKQINPPSDA